jgi:hypothetical protein
VISDFHKPLTRRKVRQIPDGGGGFTESVSDSAFRGYIAELSGAEMLRNNQLGNDATLELFTEAALDLTDRVIDEAGTIYEIVWKFTLFHRRYLLKQVT